MRYGAVLFDLDGTLTDTTGQWRQACRECAESAGIPYTEEVDAYFANGGSVRPFLTSQAVATERVEALVAERDRRVAELLRESAAWQPYAPGLLSLLSARRYAVGIVTGSWKNCVQAMHDRLSLRRMVQCIVDGDDVRPNFKPHPQGLLTAAMQLQVPPAECVYIGDLAMDMQAAKAAGMTAILVNGDCMSAEAYKHADIRVQSLREVIPHVL